MKISTRKTPTESAESYEARFRSLAERFGASLSRVAGAYEFDRSLRDDLVQEILVALWHGLAGFRGDSSLSTWVYRVAHNVALKHSRGRGRERSRRAEYERDHRQAAPTSDSGTSAADAEDPRLEALRRRIGALPALDRQIVVLQLERLDGEQIAAITGLSRTNVSTRASRARARLARELGAAQEAEPNS